MATLNKNGLELARWREVITYPVDNADCLQERIRTFSFRSNGYILTKTTTISTLFDKPDRFSTTWKRHKKCNAADLLAAAAKIKGNVLKHSEPYHLKSGGVLTYHLN